MKYCKFCEHELKNTDIFCNRCGMQQEIPSTNRSNSYDSSSISSSPYDYPQYNSEYVPPEIKVWNWGAFFLTGIWAIAMNQWVWAILSLALYFFMPFGCLVISIICGISGNEMAWKSRQWDSVGHFMDTQAVWSKWGCGCGIFSVLISFIITYALIMYLGAIDAFQNLK